MRHAFLLAAWLGLATPTGIACGQPADSLFPGLRQSELQVVTATGKHQYRVWIADDDQSRERGLMYVRDLPADRGMLFLFERPRLTAFWMKNTYLSLDIIFIAADGTIVRAALEARPLSLESIPSGVPVLGVLELPAGTASRIGLKTGDRILHPVFVVDTQQ